MRHVSPILIVCLSLLFAAVAGMAQTVTLRGSVNLAPCAAVDAAGSRAYTATVGSFKVITATSPEAPSVLGQCALNAGAITAIDVEGTTAYCAAGVTGMIVVNVANGSSPAVLTTYPLTAAVTCVAAHDTLVAVTTPTFVGLLGVRDPAHPHLLASYAQGATWVRFDAAGNRLHLGSNSGAYDLSLVYISTYSLVNHHTYGTGVISPVAQTGDAYLDVVNGALLTAIHSDDYSLVASYQAGAAIRAVAGNTDYAIIALANGGVQLINQSRQGLPEFGASASVSGAATGVAFGRSGSDSLVAVSHANGVSILSYNPLAAGDPRPELLPHDVALGVYPNPFNSTTQLNIHVPRAGRYELGLYDLLGREVGHESLMLTGNNDHTLDFSKLTSGSYFVRVSGASGTATARLLYLP